LITSKPQTSTVMSLALFLLITVVVVTMNSLVVFKGQATAWYNYAVVLILLPIGLGVFYKTFLYYKTLRFGNHQIEIRYPVQGKTKTYLLHQIDYWTENKVKTGKNSEYKELQIRFLDGKKISAGHKEYTEYDRMIQYLTQKAPKKKASSG
jgi:hypothetical protein